MSCKKRCNRRLECGHPCIELCYLPCKAGCACDEEFPSANPAVAFTGSLEETRAAPLTYAKSVKGSSGNPQAGTTSHTIVVNGSPERKRKSSRSFQRSGLLHLEDDFADRGEAYHNIPQDTQPYRDFAAGGHIESDRYLAALVEREAAEARGQQLDEENFAALFGESGDESLVNRTERMTLIRTMSNGKGGSRSVWTGTYEPSRGKKEEASLLDS